MDESDHIRCAVFGLTAVSGHVGADDNVTAPALKSVIDEYNIADHIGTFQCDNADNNNTALRELAAAVVIDVAELRLRCFDHIVNLVKALLFGEGLSKHQKELDGASESDRLKIWRKQVLLASYISSLSM